MEIITLPLAELKPALIGLGKILDKRAGLPVLSMVKVERTPDGWIALTATDLDRYATVRLEQPAEGAPFSVLVRYEDLQTSAKSCGKNDSLQLEKLMGGKVSIKTPVGAQWAETRCDSLPVAEFPATPKFDGDLVHIPDAVRAALHEAMECASQDETRLVLNGAYLDVSKKDCHCVVGTDGRHLYASNSFSLPLKSSVIVPSHRFLDWKEFNADGEWRMKVGTSPENKEVQLLQLSTRRWRFITRQLDGNYPNWRQVVPDGKDTKTTVEMDQAATESVLQAFQRMPDHDPVHHTIGLAVENGAFLLLGKANKTDTDWFSVPFPTVKATGKNVRVNTNREQLARALQFGLTRIEIIDEMSPLRLIHEGRQMVIMPVRIEGPVQTSATAPATTDTETAKSDGPGEASTVNPEPNPPPTEAGLQHPSESVSEQPGQPQPKSEATNTGGTIERLIEDVLNDIDGLKDGLSEHLQSLKSLGAKLKLMRQEQKAGVKDVETSRKTLQGLQSVKL